MIDFNEDFRTKEALVSLEDFESPTSYPTIARSNNKEIKPGMVTYIFLEIMATSLGLMALLACCSIFRGPICTSNANSNNIALNAV